MKRVSFLFLFLFAYCRSASAIPGHGAIAVEIIPNPIVAQRVSGDTYEFPFDIVVRETAGRAVTISRVTATVYGVTGMQTASASWDTPSIAAAGFSTNVPGNGELHYHFAPRKAVPTDDVFKGMRAEMRIDGFDETSTPTSATTVITVTR